MVYQGDRVGLLLPFVASFWNLDPVGFAKAVIEKAGLNEPPYYWVRFDCATWLAGDEGVWIDDRRLCQRAEMTCRQLRN